MAAHAPGVPFGQLGAVEADGALRAAICGPILDRVDFLVSLFVDGLLRRPAERIRSWRADRRMSRGRVDCALKVISGGQRGLSARWRHGRAAVSPGRLDVRGHWWRLFRPMAPITVVAVRGPVRSPSGRELWSLSGAAASWRSGLRPRRLAGLCPAITCGELWSSCKLQIPASRTGMPTLRDDGSSRLAGVGLPSGYRMCPPGVAVYDRRRYPRVQAMRTRRCWFRGLRNP
jgi:hypothetical protein